MKREIRDQAIELRKQGLSITAIANQLKVAKSSVSNWTRHIELTPQQKAKLKSQQHRWGAQNKGAQTNKARARELRQTYQNEGREAAKSGSKLHLTGCMLYWAEGAKIKKNSVHFANSDPYMIQLFMRFLREEFDIPEDKYRLQIHCHTTNADKQERIKHFWADLLGLPLNTIQKLQVKVGSQTRKNRLEYGVCALQVHSTAIVHHIYGAIQEYGGFDNPDWLF